MDRRVIIIRLCLLYATAAILSFWSFEQAYIVLVMAGLGMFPGCSPCCVTANCFACNAGTDSAQMQIDITGVVEGTCGSCASANTTYILSSTGTVGNECTYEASFATICTFNKIQWYWSDIANRAYYVLAATGVWNVQWRTGASGPQDCSVDPGAYGWNSYNTGVPNCDYTGSTATVTVL